ncbi:MAG TPA: hypothetical protein VFO16_17560 [Pseudonocardiaceae bacterium]|nr:hypothetical protein [Pseudonocardiaceae bacterium]
MRCADVLAVRWEEIQARSSTRVSFYDRVALRPLVRQWQLWRFINTGDTTPCTSISPSSSRPARLARC